MVQKLLCRWWYAMEWPAKEDITPAPPLYEALEGYPGVYIGVEVGGVQSAAGVSSPQECHHALARRELHELFRLHVMVVGDDFV